MFMFIMISSLHLNHGLHKHTCTYNNTCYQIIDPTISFRVILWCPVQKHTNPPIPQLIQMYNKPNNPHSSKQNCQKLPKMKTLQLNCHYPTKKQIPNHHKSMKLPRLLYTGDSLNTSFGCSSKTQKSKQHKDSKFHFFFPVVNIFLRNKRMIR